MIFRQQDRCALNLLFTDLSCLLDKNMKKVYVSEIFQN